VFERLSVPKNVFRANGVDGGGTKNRKCFGGRGNPHLVLRSTRSLLVLETTGRFGPGIFEDAGKKGGARLLRMRAPQSRTRVTISDKRRKKLADPHSAFGPGGVADVVGMKAGDLFVRAFALGPSRHFRGRTGRNPARSGPKLAQHLARGARFFFWRQQ